MNHRLLSVVVCVLLLAGCKDRQSQDTYKASEMGTSRSVEFGTVLNVREVDITGENSGTGMLLGAGVGAGGGSYVGNGSGNTWATVGAALAGAVAGHYAEQAMNDRKGYEYVVQLQSGEVKTITQEKNEKDHVFKAGEHAMIQYCDAGEKSRRCADNQYQRLLPVQKMPAYAKKRKKSVKGDVDAAEFN